MIGTVWNHLQPDQEPNGVSKAEAQGGESSLQLLQGESVPQNTPCHLSSEQTLSWFWSADLEHLRGILLESDLDCILPFHSFMQACFVKPPWILSQNGNSEVKKSRCFQEESEPDLWFYIQTMLAWFCKEKVVLKPPELF